ncbi:MAG: cadherin repeat domain-containing protein, partial [Planctomycetaceae bacterium]|nr:cadherin repeat domain-containing protein [Planctomycetaceae bacterium]
MTAKAEDFNPDVGTPVFALEAAAEGMSINAETGEIQWSTSADIAPGRYSGKVILTQKNNDELRVEKDFTVTVQLPNDAPSIEVPPEAVAVIGREFILTVAASDDGPTESLHYSLTGDNVPSGLAVDEKQGVLKWTPPRTFSPGEYKVNVTVTDSGEPAKSATGIVNLKVQDDTAAMTKFTGVVDRDGVPMAWFWNQAQNRKPELRVGQHIVEADINAEITEIDRRHVLMKDAAGVWRLNLGETLRQRQLIEPAMPSTDNTSPEAETSDTANSETSSAPTTPTSDAPATDGPTSDEQTSNKQT